MEHPELQKERERHERIMRIKALAQKGVDRSNKTIGYHATTLEGLKYMIEQGHLPGSATDQDDLMVKASISMFLAGAETPHGNTHEDMLRYISSYAESRGFEHELMRQLGFDISQEDVYDLISDVYNFYLGILPKLSEQGLDLLSKKTGKTKKEILAIVTNIAQKFKGILLSINKNVSDVFDVKGGVEIGEHIIQQNKQAFTLDFVTGIQACGEAEKEYIHNL